MLTWILIVYIYGGGPVQAVFHSKQSCEDAAYKLQKDHPIIVDWAMCFEDKQQ